jgi:hypothetical protein
MAKSEFFQQEISLKRHEIMVLQAKLIDAIGRETGVRPGTVVKKNGREWQVTHLEGESAQHMAVYGVVKTKYALGRRPVWLGFPSSLEVVK